MWHILNISCEITLSCMSHNLTDTQPVIGLGYLNQQALWCHMALLGRAELNGGSSLHLFPKLTIINATQLNRDHELGENFFLIQSLIFVPYRSLLWCVQYYIMVYQNNIFRYW